MLSFEATPSCATSKYEYLKVKMRPRTLEHEWNWDSAKAQQLQLLRQGREVWKCSAIGYCGPHNRSETKAQKGSSCISSQYQTGNHGPWHSCQWQQWFAAGGHDAIPVTQNQALKDPLPKASEAFDKYLYPEGLIGPQYHYRLCISAFSWLSLRHYSQAEPPWHVARFEQEPLEGPEQPHPARDCAVQCCAMHLYKTVTLTVLQQSGAGATLLSKTLPLLYILQHSSQLLDTPPQKYSGRTRPCSTFLLYNS